MTKKNICLLISVFILASCGIATTRPKTEMSYAQAAFIAARRANAQKFAPGVYRKAEFYYLKAKSAYRTKNFNKAKTYAELSKKFSEKAELLSVLKNPNPGQ